MENLTITTLLPEDNDTVGPLPKTPVSLRTPGRGMLLYKCDQRVYDIELFRSGKTAFECGG